MDFEEYEYSTNIPWYWVYTVRAFGSIAGAASIFLGYINYTFNTGFTGICLSANFWQMLIGVIVFASECLIYWIARFTFWKKAIFYTTSSIPILIYCANAYSLGGCVPILLTGFFYIVLAFLQMCRAMDQIDNNISNAESQQVQPQQEKLELVY